MIIQPLQLFRYCFVHLTDGEELPVAQRRNDSRFRETNGGFRRAFVLGFADAGWNNCRSVILSQFLVVAVEHRLVSSVGCGGGLAVVWNQQPGDSAKIVEGVDMAGQPVLYCPEQRPADVFRKPIQNPYKH